MGESKERRRCAVIENIKKRNGETARFNPDKISDAIRKANMESTDKTMTGKVLASLTAKVVQSLDILKKSKNN